MTNAALFHIGDPFQEPVSSSKLAEAYEVDIRSIQNWDEKGWIHRKERGLYILGEVVRGVYEAQLALINKKKGPELPEGFESTDEAERRKKIAEANIKELEEAEKRKDLISSELVRMQAFEKARTIRDTFENMPSRISAILAAESDPHKVREIMTNEIRKNLEELSR